MSNYATWVLHLSWVLIGAGVLCFVAAAVASRVFGNLEWAVTLSRAGTLACGTAFALAVLAIAISGGA